MTDEQKKTIAAFRFGVICELVNGARLSTGEQVQLIRDKCTRKWQIPHSEKTRISRGDDLARDAVLSGIQWAVGVALPAGSQRPG